MNRKQIADAVVAAFTKMLNGFGFNVTVHLEEKPEIDKQMIAESMTEVAKAAAAVLMAAGIQMGNVSK